MSIWCSHDHIGTDPNAWIDADTGKPIPRAPHRGNVLSYAEGFSNHHPDLTGTHERPAGIATASIAPWCVPGHDEDCQTCKRSHYGGDEVGPWLRIEVAAPESLNFWTPSQEPEVEEQGATVVLDVEAVTALRDDLDRWLDQRHLYPSTKDDR